MMEWIEFFGLLCSITAPRAVELLCGGELHLWRLSFDMSVFVVALGFWLAVGLLLAFTI